MSGRRAVFLDRDGVLVGSDVADGTPVPTTGGVHVLPEAPEACALLRGAGFTLVMVTNQPDIARGKISAEQVAADNRTVLEATGVDAAYVCPHDDVDDCPCRKPRPGMLLDAARDLNLDLVNSFMVGDRWRDIDAGRAAGCRTVHVDRGWAERAPESPDTTVSDVLEAATWICATAVTPLGGTP